MNLFGLFRPKKKLAEDSVPRIAPVFQPNEKGPLSESGKILSGYEGATQVISDLDNKDFAHRIANRTHVTYYSARDGVNSCINRTRNPHFKEQFSYIYFDEEDKTHLIFMYLYLKDSAPKHNHYGAQVFQTLMDSNIEDTKFWTDCDAGYKNGCFVAMRNYDSDNLHSFVKNIKEGMMVVEAAKATFTGKMLLRNNYKYISRVVIIHDEDGNVSYVYVFFDNHIRTAPYSFPMASRFLD